MNTTKARKPVAGKPVAAKKVAVKKVAAKKVAVARKAPAHARSPVSASPAAAKPNTSTKPAGRASAPAAAVVGAAMQSNGKAHTMAAAVAKPRKRKPVRDSFTMQAQEYEVLTSLKQTFKANGEKVKKSDLVRVAVGLLHGLELPALKVLLAKLP
jgi:hypothetical protein